uniref:Uncharacterized protein n=1 Tax=Rhizophora mucronata TaxID=61149 RepID=A0A2P2JX04_RHIMU
MDLRFRLHSSFSFRFSRR